MALIFRLLLPYLLVTSFAMQATPTADLQSQSGGMAAYGRSFQNSASPSQTKTACSGWNAYVLGRSQWSLSSTLITRLANADWNARQAGAPTITSQQLANASNHLMRML
jgi:hypothetical protein